LPLYAAPFVTNGAGPLEHIQVTSHNGHGAYITGDMFLVEAVHKTQHTHVPAADTKGDFIYMPIIVFFLAFFLS
jgi:hypothetical protein